MILSAADAVADQTTLITVLLALLGIAATVIGFTVIPRMIGQLVPSNRVDEVRASAATQLAKAEAEAATWKEAFGSMKEAHDGLLDINRSTQQSAVIANSVMTAIRQQLPGGVT
jgi:hypothetical protein